MPADPPRVPSRYAPAAERTRLQKARDRATFNEIAAVLLETGGDRDAMAGALGISRRQLYREAEAVGFALPEHETATVAES